MDAETKEVVKNIAQIQIEALTNIKNNITTTEPDLLRKLLQINDEEMLDSVNHHIQIYEEIYEMPLNEYQLYICSHILFKMEDEWVHDLSQGVYVAWELLHRETNKFHPELTLII